MAYNPKDFGYKDSLLSGNPEKVIKGSDFDSEFQAIKRELDAIDDELHPDGGDGDLVHEPPNTGKNYVRQGGTGTWKEIGTEFVNDTNFVSEDSSKDLGAESRRWNKLWADEVDASGDVNIGGDISVGGDANIDGALEIHGNIIIDGGQIVDPDGNPAGGIGAGSNIGDVPKWNGSEWVPTLYKTNDLNDVQSELASLDQFLIYNGSHWIAEDFHIDTTLNFQGAVDLTGTAPANPENGDLYINDTDGTIGDGSWGPIAGTHVLAGNVVGFSSDKGRWYLLGDIGSAAVTQVREGDCIVVNDDQPSRPIVGLTLETQGHIDLGVEAHSWGNHAGDISSLESALSQEVTDRKDGDKDLQDKINDLEALEGTDISGLQDQITQEVKERKDGDDALQGQITEEAAFRENADNALQDQITQNKNDFDSHTHALDDLTDVNTGTPTRDDLIIWNGSNWAADDFKFIQTALRFKGGVAPTAAAPTNPEGGDLYVFEEGGTVGASWGVIAGREVQVGKFVGYAADPNNRWFLLGDMAEVGVTNVSQGPGISVDDSKPSEPVVSINRTDVDKWYEPKFAKNTGFNKNFGTTSGTVAQGNHTHSQYLTEFTETDPTVPSHVKSISQADINKWNNPPSGGGDLDWVNGDEDKLIISLGWENNPSSRGVHQVLIGSDVNAREGAVAIGHGPDAGEQGVAVGLYAYAGTNSVAIGTQATAADDAIGLGNYATAVSGEFAISTDINAVNFSGATVQATDYLDADGNSIIGAGGTNLPNGTTSGEVLVWNGSSWVGRDTLTVDPWPPGGATFKGLISANGFKAASSSDASVLLGGGGTKAVSDFAGSGDSYKKTETKRNLVMTEAEYNALSSKDAETIYFLT